MTVIFEYDAGNHRCFRVYEWDARAHSFAAEITHVTVSTSIVLTQGDAVGLARALLEALPADMTRGIFRSVSALLGDPTPPQPDLPFTLEDIQRVMESALAQALPASEVTRLPSAPLRPVSDTDSSDWAGHSTRDVWGKPCARAGCGHSAGVHTSKSGCHIIVRADRDPQVYCLCSEYLAPVEHSRPSEVTQEPEAPASESPDPSLCSECPHLIVQHSVTPGLGCLVALGVDEYCPCTARRKP